MRRAYSYKRFSSPKQARGDSIRRQTEFEQQIVKEMDLLLDDSLDLSDTGVSAFRGKNSKFGALAEFLKLVEAGKVPEGSVLIVENVDRLSRQNVYDAFGLFSRIIGAGITLVTAEPRDTYDKESVQGNVAKLMIPLVYMMRAHDESKTKSLRVSQAWNGRRKRAVEDGQPLTVRCPAWLRVRKGVYEVVESRAEVVRNVFRWVRDGYGVGAVVSRLVKEKVPAFGPSDHWNRTYVRKLLCWPAVYGEMQPYLFTDGVRAKTGRPVQGYFPAVVTREEYEEARVAMRSRRGTEGRASSLDANLFTGLVRHAGDRCKMSMKASGPSGKKIAYLRSNLVDKGLSAREGRQFPYAKFERAVLEALCELTPKDLADPAAGDQKGAAEAIKKLGEKLFEIDEKSREVEEKFVDPKNKIPGKVLLNLMSQLAESRAEIEGKLTRLKEQTVGTRPGGLKDAQTVIGEMMKTGSGEERERYRRKARSRLRWLLTEIWVHIEKVNHVRQFAHVQLFLRNGAKKDLVVTSFEGAGVAPARSYHKVDFRTYTPTAAERAVGRGRLREQSPDK